MEREPTASEYPGRGDVYVRPGAVDGEESTTASHLSPKKGPGRRTREYWGEKSVGGRPRVLNPVRGTD